jgi:hypothetical protein
MVVRRVSKPIRLHVLTIFIVVAYGILPFVSTMPSSRGFLLFGLWNLALNGSIWVLFDPNGEAPLLLILVSLFLCVFSAAAAIWAFAGDREGRTATLILISLDVLWWTALVLQAIAMNNLPGSSVIRLVIEVIPPFGWLGFIWWNFTRGDIEDYYKYRQHIQEESV